MTLAHTWTGNQTLATSARSSGVAPYHRIVTPVDTAQTASTESIGFAIGGTNANPPLTVTRQWATGAYAGSQRENLFTAPTYNTVGSSSWAGATVATVAISGAPTIGGNITGSPTPCALWVQAGVTALAGNVGIGTTNPQQIVHIKSAGSSSIRYERAANTNYATFEFYTTSGSVQDWGVGTRETSDSDFHFYSGSGGLSRDVLTIGRSSGTSTFFSVAGSIAIIAKAAASRTAALVQLQTSAGASIGTVGGTVANDFADINSASTDGTTEDILATYTSPANCLIINGDSLEEMEHVLTVASATATRRIKKYFAGTLIFDSGVLTLAIGTDFTIWTTIIRESSTVVRCDVSVTSTSASTVPYSTYTRITGLTLSGTNVLVTKCLVGGAGAAAADVVEKLSKTWCSPAA